MNDNKPSTESVESSQVVYVAIPSNGMAVTAFIFSLLTLVSGIAGIVGIALGWIALHQIAEGRKEAGRGIATAAIAIPLTLYGLWWLVVGLFWWFSLGIVKDILSSLALDQNEPLSLFVVDEIQDRAILLVFSGVVAVLCAVIIPIKLNTAISRKQPISRQQTLAMIGLPLCFIWLLIVGLAGHMLMLVPLLAISVIATVITLLEYPGVREIESRVDFSIISFRRDILIMPRDSTSAQLLLVATSWLVTLTAIFVFWILTSNIIPWYLGLTTGLAIAIFSVITIPTLLNIDISKLQSIDLKAVAGKAFWPSIALVTAGIIGWIVWIVYFLALAFLIVMGVQRSRVATS